MRLVRLLVGTLLFAVAATAVAWLSAPWWLANIARHELENLGFQQVIVDIDDIGLQQSRISRLHLKQQQGGLELDSVNATLSYNIPGLLRQQIDSLSLETIDILLHPTPQVQPESALILASPALLFSQIPIGKVNIDHIFLRRLDVNGDMLQELSGQASYRDQVLSLSMSETGNGQGLQAALSLNAQGQCRGNVSRGNLEIVRAECLITEQESLIAMQGSMHANLAALDEILGSWVEMPKHSLTGDMQLTWTASLPSTSDRDRLLQALTLNAELSMDTTLVNNSQAFTVLLNSSVAYEQGSGSWEITDNSLLRFGDRLKSRLSFKSMTGTFTTLEPLSLSLNKGSGLQLQNLHSEDMSIPNLNIRLLRPLQLTVAEVPGLQLVQATEVAVNTGTVQWQDKRLSSQSINIRLKPGKLTSPAGSIQINAFELRTDKVNKIPALKLAAEFDLSHEPVTANGSLASNDHMLYLDWSLSHHLAKESGKLNFSLRPVALTAAAPLLARMLDDSSRVGMQGGTFNSKGQLQWNASKAFTGEISLDLENMKGFYQTTTFTGLNADMDLSLNDRALHITTNTLHADTLDPGLPLSNVSMSATVNYPFDGPVGVQITDLQAEALGGLISSEKIDIDTGRRSNPFLIRLAHIDAGQLAEFRKQEGLTAEGKLDGMLPFDWTDSGLKMTAGKLTSRDPGGLIRYLGSASVQQLAATDTATHMAMQILSDFRFKLLHIQADYQPDGQLALQLSLKGNNPGYEKGRPIEFNFNIEENVLKLLQSLRMANDISDRLEKKVQKKMKK